MSNINVKHDNNVITECILDMLSGWFTAPDLSISVRVSRVSGYPQPRRQRRPFIGSLSSPAASRDVDTGAEQTRFSS